MARRLLVLLGLFLACSVSAKAQRAIDLFTGYSYERFDVSPNARNLNGFEIAPQIKLASWLGVVADLDAQFTLPSEVDVRTLHFLVGPQISIPAGRFSPYVHVLAGFAHATDNGFIANSFGAAFGGGVDMRIVPLVSWRVVQVDDMVTHFYASIQHSPRISTGLVFRF